MSHYTSEHELILKSIISEAVDGIITINEKGIIESVNPATTRIFGYTEKEMVGNSVNMLMPEPDHSRHDMYMENYHKTGKARIIGIGREVKGRRKDGTIFPFLLSISEIKLSNKRIYTGIIHDISELKEMRNELAKERELNELKSKFVTLASHEFRTPLSTILSSVSLISKYIDLNDKEKAQKHVMRIRSSVENLTSILNDFLSLSKLEEGKITNVPVNIDIEEFINEAREEMMAMAKEGQQILYQHHGAKKELCVDRNIMKNILINLISNAIKYSDAGKRIFVTSAENNGYMSISIRDEGIGIPEQDIPHLFSRFFRAHNAGQVQGTGLGLHIVKKYLDILNGTIELKSKLNEGTEFIINIPAVKHENHISY